MSLVARASLALAAALSPVLALAQAVQDPGAHSARIGWGWLWAIAVFLVVAALVFLISRDRPDQRRRARREGTP